MLLRTLYLKAEGDDLSTDYCYELRGRSRALCNYLEREVLGRARYETEGFNRIVIRLTPTPSRPTFVNSSNVACLDVPFDRARYDALTTDEDRDDFFIDALTRGLTKCARTLDIPKTDLVRGMKQFVKGGRKNEWVHKRKRFARHDLEAVLSCSLTRQKFSLHLDVDVRGTRVVSKLIRETGPDENVFHYFLRDIVLQKGVLTVTQRVGKPLWSEKIAKLEAMANKKETKKAPGKRAGKPRTK